MFSILIPTWDNLDYLKTCIQSIQEHSGIQHQILVHVNGADQKTLSYLQAEAIEHTQSPENIGICNALNLLAAKAKHNYIVYMNDDMYALPQWDEVLINEIEALGTDDFYLSATMIEPKKGGHNCMISPHDYGDIQTEFRIKDLIAEFKDLRFYDWNGASWPPAVVHKKWWDKVGGYSEEFSPGLYSDPDFSMKLWQNGIRIFKGVSASRVYHFQSKSLHRVKLNNGNKQFKQKWGIAASYFYKNYLQLGTPFTGPLPEIEKGLGYFWARLKAKFG